MLTIVTLLFLTGLFEKLPEATLAAVVIAAVIELVDIPALRRLYRLHTAGLGRIYGIAARADFIAAFAAMLGVLIFDTLPGLFIGIAVSLAAAALPRVAAARRRARPRARDPTPVRRRRRAPRQPAGARRRRAARRERALLRQRRRRAQRRCWPHAGEGIKAVVIDAETVPFIDVTAATMLAALAEDLERDGVVLILAREVGQVRDLLGVAEGDKPLIRTYPSVRAAVDAAQHF